MQLSIIAYNCSGVKNSNQKWSFDPASGEISIAHGLVKRCLTADTSIFDGALVSTRPCDDSSLQKWDYTHSTGKLTNQYVDGVTGSHSKKCLDLFGGLAVDGAKIGLWSCGSGSDDNQSWAFQNMIYKMIESIADSKSIAVLGGGLTAAPLSDVSAHAHWNLEVYQGGTAGQPDYRIRNRATNEFLILQGNSVTIGKIEPSWVNARWVLRNLPENGQNVYSIQSLHNPKVYLVLRNGIISPGQENEVWSGGAWRLKTVE
jgi:Ricin-type beta-trefoil lectin domain